MEAKVNEYISLGTRVAKGYLPSFPISIGFKRNVCFIYLSAGIWINEYFPGKISF